MNWTDRLLDWVPMLLLIAVWIFFILRMRGGGSLLKIQQAYGEEQKRQTAVLERIATALEKLKP